jgi:dienelactone hydrolase
MILIPGGTLESEFGLEILTDYFMDRYEVTNRQYKDFIDRGGYKNPAFWKQEFVKNGQALTWDEAMAEFIDSMERPGPSTWKAGNYPEGEDDYPVRGIGWYEAAAYAEFAGKSLPSFYHWHYAAGLNGEAAVRTFTHVPLLSNFTNRSPAPVGSFQGISQYGVYDMAGNVREWCWNELAKGRCVCGSSWVEPMKIFGNFETVNPFDRSKSNGFRCAIYRDSSGVTTSLAPLQDISSPLLRDYASDKPCSDEVFEIIKSLYTYEKTDLAPRIESDEATLKGFSLQKVSFSAAYGGERMAAYICLPRSSDPPYQAVIFGPGASATIMSSLNMEDLKFWDFIAKTGRAFVWPVYKWTFERGGGPSYEEPQTWGEYQDREIKNCQDLARTIDYLETNPRFDSEKICYMGFSGGALWGTTFPALENRIKNVILVCGGFRQRVEAPPAVRRVNMAARIKVPVLMINGKYDQLFPLETSQIPLLKILKTPKEDKRHVILDTDHSVWVKHDIVIKEILDWLDKYLGPVK